MASMFGPLAIILVLVVGIPVAVIMSCAVIAALLGYFVKDDVDRTYAGSELLETNY